MSLRSDINELKRRVCTIESCGNGIAQETDPIFSASPAFNITNTNITNWNAAATATTNGSFVSRTGNVTENVDGAKTFTGNVTFSNRILTGGLVTGGGIFTGATANVLNFSQSTGVASVFARFQPTTGNLYLQAPGNAPAENNNRLTVDGTTLLNGAVTATSEFLPSVNGSGNIGNVSNRWGSVWSNSFLNAGTVFYGTTLSAAGVYTRQGPANQIISGLHPNGGGGFVQAPGVAPAVNGFMWSVYGDQLVQGNQRITGNITQASTGSIYTYNTTDEVTNYERLKIGFEGNNIILRGEANGTGTLRTVQVGNGLFANSSNSNVSITGRLILTSGLQGANAGQGSTTSHLRIHGANVQPDANTLSSGVASPLQILPVYQQSGTAGSTDLVINRVETSLGSGLHRLVDFQVGGTSRFNITNAGIVTVIDQTITNTKIAAWDTVAAGSYITTNTQQLTLTGNKTTTGFWIFSTAIRSPQFDISNAGVAFHLPAGVANTVFKLQPVTGNAVFQTAGTASIADNGYRVSVLGTSLFSGVANFTDTWANSQITVGQAAQGGRIVLNNGANGVAGLELGYSAATTPTPRLLSTVSGGLAIQATHGSGEIGISASGASGLIRLSTAGAIRLTIDAAGRATFTDDIVLSTIGKNLAFRSPDGTYYKLVVANGGGLNTVVFIP